jgi:hypothetical protein
MFSKLTHSLLILVLLATSPVLAQKKEPETIPLTLYGVKEAEPALSQRLLPTLRDCRPGNSAIFYYRALHAAYRNDPSRKAMKQLEDNLDTWRKSVDNAEQREVMKKCLAEIAPQMFHDLKDAAYREETNFTFRLQDITGMDAISFLLPELQDTRSVSRALALRTRIAVHEARFENARHDLLVQLRLAKIVSQEPILINRLVGISIGTATCTEIEQFIAQPNAPSLYWALSAIPQPFITMHDAIEFEAGLPEQILPVLKDPRNAKHSAAEWEFLFLNAYKQLSSSGVGTPEMSEFPKTEEAFKKLLEEAHAPAKKALVELGFTEAQIDAMPAGQVLAIHMHHVTKTHSDNMCKVVYGSPADYKQLSQKFSEQLAKSKAEVPVATGLASMILPAVEQTYTAEIRLEQQFAALRTLEAIRLHLAATGKLPNTLTDVTLVPIPHDPFTQQPFAYKTTATGAELLVTSAKQEKKYVLSLGVGTK